MSEPAGDPAGDGDAPGRDRDVEVNANAGEGANGHPDTEPDPDAKPSENAETNESENQSENGDADSGADGGAREGTDAGTEYAVGLDWGESGLVPAVAQDADTGEVLMLAYVSRDALAKTRETGVAHYHSRSRDERWRKGESSGHVQRVESVRVDCDGDALLYRVHQEGGACHTGFRSCFHRDLDGTVVGERVFDPEEVYDGER